MVDDQELDDFLRAADAPQLRAQKVGVTHLRLEMIEALGREQDGLERPVLA